MGYVDNVDMGYIDSVDMGYINNVDMGCIVDVDVGCVKNVDLGQVIVIVDMECVSPQLTWVVVNDNDVGNVAQYLPHQQCGSGGGCL